MADTEAVRRAAEPTLKGLGLGLVDVTFEGAGRARTLRLSVERLSPGEDPIAVDLDALAQATAPVSAVLDAAEVISGPYTLEVSSPGLERPLRRPGDFSRFVGTTITVKTHQPFVDARRHRGTLLEAGAEEIVLEVDGAPRRLPYEGMASARTVFEWGPAPRPGDPKGRKR